MTTYLIRFGLASLVVCVVYPLVMSRTPRTDEPDSVAIKIIEERMRDSQC